MWLAGVATIAVSIAVAALLYQFGYFVGAIVVAVLCALVFTPVGYLLARGREDEPGDGWVLGVALCGTVIAVGASVAGQEEILLTGSTARDVVAADAPWSNATFLHFRNARVLVGRSDFVAVWAGSRGSHHISYYLRVAPIVDAGWTPGQRIGAFAVLGSPVFNHGLAEWRQPLNGGIRVNAVHAEQLGKAVQDFRSNGNFNVAANPAFVRWIADPEGEAAAGWWRLAQTLLIASIIWAVMAVIGLFIAVTRRPR